MDIIAPIPVVCFEAVVWLIVYRTRTDPWGASRGYAIYAPDENQLEFRRSDYGSPGTWIWSTPLPPSKFWLE